MLAGMASKVFGCRPTRWCKDLGAFHALTVITIFTVVLILTSLTSIIIVFILLLFTRLAANLCFSGYCSGGPAMRSWEDRVVFDLRRCPTCSSRADPTKHHVSYSLNRLKGGYIEDYIGDYYRGY